MYRIYRRRNLILVAVWLLLARLAWGAPAIVAETNLDDDGDAVVSVASNTYQITTSSVSNPALFVSVGTLRLDANWHASGVTFNGDAMTLVTGSQVTSLGGGYDPGLEWWVLVNPDVGTYDIVVTYNSTSTRPSQSQAYFLSGVDQTTPYEAVETGASTTTSLSDSITTLTDNTIVLQANIVKVACTGIDQDNSQTETMDVDETSVGDTMGAAASYLAVATAGATTMGVSSLGAGDDNVQSLVAIKPAAASARRIIT